VHAQLVEHLGPYGGALQHAVPFDLATDRGIAALNAMVTRQAQMIGYNNHFKALFVLTIAVLPLLLLLRAGRSAKPVVPAE
jgi:DHA2 family multidrug resistance protein